VYRISPGMRSAIDRDSGIVLNLERGKIFRLNGIGVFIFEQIRDRKDEAEIVASICKDHAVEPRIVRAHVADFLGSLERLGLIVAAGANAMT
jgi:hypothetical protein